MCVHACTSVHTLYAPENTHLRILPYLCHVCARVSDSRDDQRGGEEQRSQQAAPAVGVLPLTQVHLAAAVVAAAAHAEEEADDGHEDGEQQAHRRAHQEAYLVVDGLGVSGGEERKEKK